jgi:hypothetical protein
MKQQLFCVHYDDTVHSDTYTIYIAIFYRTNVFYRLSRDSSVGLWAGRPGSRGSIPGRSKRFFSSP